jgi:hypothetical protein
MGIIKIGSQVVVTLKANKSNKGNAVLLAGLGVDPANGQHKVIEPDLTDSITLNTTKKSVLEIQTHFGANDGGELSDTVDGVPRDSAAAEDETTWIYSVQ